MLAVAARARRGRLPQGAAGQSRMDEAAIEADLEAGRAELELGWVRHREVSSKAARAQTHADRAVRRTFALLESGLRK